MARTTTHEGDLVAVLTSDHRAVDSAFEKYESGGLSEEQRRDLVDHIITELVRHSVAEEQYLYPAAREHLPGGDELADHEIEEHAEAEKLMKELERLEVSDPEFDEKVLELARDIRHHVEEEERGLFPRLQAACTVEELRHLGDKILEAKEHAPTRPHPSAPDTPPANMVLDRGAGMIDRLRDALSGRQR
ncbi:hemerythrin domain-containing protein [Saccharopolyspora aridisoli]|uniref:Hemerythrin domain-containing protein n=1 Tax=Saccharopolyspora aridisoli TaxID=2530385 RepID=A0A4R4UX94_9PSEU|nr:hemerythrin domain-containing protein [Saccharopolyspora aridisoli]TDC93403.1 hemerythrin domain-containing protein [Saccharopolyspora aridisoli]